MPSTFFFSCLSLDVFSFILFARARVLVMPPIGVCMWAMKSLGTARRICIVRRACGVIVRPHSALSEATTVMGYQV